jgi:hypothetical protein
MITSMLSKAATERVDFASIFGLVTCSFVGDKTACE